MSFPGERPLKCMEHHHDTLLNIFFDMRYLSTQDPVNLFLVICSSSSSSSRDSSSNYSIFK